MGGQLSCINTASDAFIHHYNEPVGPDVPVVQELIQILSPCVLRQALKKQMTHGGRPHYQYTRLPCHLYGCWQHKTHLKRLEWLLHDAGSAHRPWCSTERFTNTQEPSHYCRKKKAAIILTAIGSDILLILTAGRAHFAFYNDDFCCWISLFYIWIIWCTEWTFV